MTTPTQTSISAGAAAPWTPRVQPRSATVVATLLSIGHRSDNSLPDDEQQHHYSEASVQQLHSARPLAPGAFLVHPQRHTSSDGAADPGSPDATAAARYFRRVGGDGDVAGTQCPCPLKKNSSCRSLMGAAAGTAVPDFLEAFADALIDDDDVVVGEEGGWIQ